MEIIMYMEKRNKITSEYAKRLRDQLREKGLRSFGSKKGADYYLRHNY